MTEIGTITRRIGIITITAATIIASTIAITITIIVGLLLLLLLYTVMNTNCFKKAITLINISWASTMFIVAATTVRIATDTAKATHSN